MPLVVPVGTHGGGLGASRLPDILRQSGGGGGGLPKAAHHKLTGPEMSAVHVPPSACDSAVSCVSLSPVHSSSVREGGLAHFKMSNQ